MPKAWLLAGDGFNSVGFRFLHCYAYETNKIVMLKGDGILNLDFCLKDKTWLKELEYLCLFMHNRFCTL